MKEIKKILERRSERNYKKIKIKKEKIEKILQVINSSPTSTNSQDFSAIIVTDNELKKEITLGYETQKHIVEAPLFIIFCADMNRIKYIAEKENKEIHINSINNFLTASGDAFIAASFAANAAIQLDLGVCYIGMVRASIEKIQKKLNLTGNILPIIGLTIGYPEFQNEIKPKINHIFTGKYDIEKLQGEVNTYDKEMLKYYDSRNANKKNSNWSETCLNPFLNGDTGKKIDEIIKSVWKIN